MFSGFKTLVFAALVAVTSFAASPEVVAFVAENFPAFGAGLATVIAVLRAVTSSPIFNRDKVV